MMDGDKAVVAVIDVIKALTLPDFDGDAVHKYDPPEEVSGEYIAVDHLPFVFD